MKKRGTLERRKDKRSGASREETDAVWIKGTLIKQGTQKDEKHAKESMEVERIDGLKKVRDWKKGRERKRRKFENQENVPSALEVYAQQSSGCKVEVRH